MLFNSDQSVFGDVTIEGDLTIEGKITIDGKNFLGHLDDGTPLYSKTLRGVSGESVFHGIENAATDQRIVLISAQYLDNTLMRQISMEHIHYDDTIINICIPDHADSYIAFILVIYR